MDKSVSLHFSAAKVIAILVVVTGHWFKELPLWPLATVALFLFGFSSSFFTGRMQGQHVDVRAFWKNKLQRLGVRYWLILAMLGLFLTAQGRDVFHWHTLVHVAGLSGILNLFGPSMSALGNGLWFFTLLLFFYAVYPVLARLLVASTRTTVLLAATVAGLLLLDEFVVGVGFALWLTMLGFILGVYVGVNRLVLRTAPLHVLLLVTPVLLVLGRAMVGSAMLNTVLLGLFALALSLRLTIPGRPVNALRPLVALEACLLEIYLIHNYLFVRPTGNAIVDFTISLALIVTCAMLLNAAGNRLVARIFAPRAAPAACAPAAADEDDESMASAA